ncbi:MAG: hypothetical protein ACK6A8_19480 [Planctomycetota bacterium]
MAIRGKDNVHIHRAAVSELTNEKPRGPRLRWNVLLSDGRYQ